MLARQGAPLGVVELPVPGRHNAANAAGAAAIALELGVPFEAVRRGARRVSAASPAGSSSAGERDGVTYVDDYAHLPERRRRA